MESRKRIKKAISTGAKTSNQPMLPVMILIRKRITLNSIPSEITAFLKPV